MSFYTNSRPCNNRKKYIVHGGNSIQNPNCEKENNSCDAILKGKCNYGRFEAGIEEYFIPESKAESIDRIVRKGKSKISIKVKKDGTALLEDLILVDN